MLVTTYALREQQHREIALSERDPEPASPETLPQGLVEEQQFQMDLRRAESAPRERKTTERARSASAPPSKQAKQHRWEEERFALLQEYQKAFENLQAGQLDAAQSAFQRIATNPENTAGLGYDGLAAIYFEKGNLPEAKEALQKSLTANSVNIMALLIQGDISFAMGEKEKSTSEYLRATQSETLWGWQKALAYNALGVSDFLNSKQAEAKECFDQALSADKSSLATHSNLGYLSWQEGDLKKAQAAFMPALTLERGYGLPKTLRAFGLSESTLPPEQADELSRTLLTMISTPKSEEPTKEAREKILLIPFTIGGGNLRRLGEGEALVWQLAHQLPPSLRYEITSQDVLRRGQRGGLIPDPTTLITLAKEKGAAYVVWGELQSFVTKLIVHGQIAEVKTGTVKRVSYTQEGMDGRLEAAAQILAEQIASPVTQKQNEKKP